MGLLSRSEGNPSIGVNRTQIKCFYFYCILIIIAFHVYILLAFTVHNIFYLVFNCIIKFLVYFGLMELFSLARQSIYRSKPYINQSRVLSTGLTPSGYNIVSWRRKGLLKYLVVQSFSMGVVVAHIPIIS